MPCYSYLIELNKTKKREEIKMKKSILKMTAGIMAGVMVFGTALSVSAAGVTIDEAKKTALTAAGVAEEQIIFKQAFEDTDDGRQIFEVDFFVPGEVKYEFDIDAASGAIVERDMDLWEAEDDFEYAALIQAAAASSVEPAAPNTVPGEITELQAKTVALKDAGFVEGDVVVSKCIRDFDDGVEKFEVEFRLSDGTEYSYDISAKDGRILEREIDRECEFDLDWD